jgi:hypothetical protein
VSSVAAAIGAALAVLSVLLTGKELSLEAAVRSCLRSSGALLAVATLALVAGLVVALRPSPSSGESNRRKRVRT